MDSEIKPLQILVLTRSTHFHQNGIFENHVKTLYEGLEKKGHFITILTTAHPSGIKTIKDKRIKWIFLEQTPKGIYSKSWAKRSAAYYTTYLKDETFDLVHCQSLSGFEFLKKHYPLNCPVITTRHNTFYHDFMTHCLRAKQHLFMKRWLAYSRYYIDFRRKFRYWEKPCFENSDYHIAISNHQKEVYQNVYKIRQEKSFVVPNSILPPMINTATQFSHPKNIEKKYLLSSHLKDSDSKFITSFVILIIKLLNTFPHLHFVFTGSKKSLSKLKKQCKKKQIYSQCLFIEKQSFDDIFAIHNRCLYYLSFSKEILGYDRLQLSLMQNGHIIILNQNKFPSSLITHQENGLVLPLQNSSLAAKNIIELIQNDNKKNMFLAQSKLTIDHLLSTEKMIDDIEQVFYDIKVKNEKI